MNFARNFKTFDLENGVPMLVYLENDGDDCILHFIVWPEELGTVDLKLGGPADNMESAFDLIDQERAQGVFDEQISGLLEAILGDDDEEDPENG